MIEADFEQRLRLKRLRGFNLCVSKPQLTVLNRRARRKRSSKRREKSHMQDRRRQEPRRNVRRSEVGSRAEDIEPSLQDMIGVDGI